MPVFLQPVAVPLCGEHQIPYLPGVCLKQHHPAVGAGAKRIDGPGGGGPVFKARFA
ncbi:hypothetical protein D3C81_2099050 [compost metagenome]